MQIIFSDESVNGGNKKGDHKADDFPTGRSCSADWEVELVDDSTRNVRIGLEWQARDAEQARTWGMNN